MALNFPGPYEVRIFYTVTTLTHEQRLNVRLNADPVVGTPFNEIEVLLRGDVVSDLQTEVDDWMTAIRPLFNNTTTIFTHAELWKYVPDSFAADFVSAHTINLPGNIATATQFSSQLIQTFRTTEGGIMKVSFMETIVAPAPSVAGIAPGAVGTPQSFVIAANTPWLARDTSYPFVAIASHPGQNEAVFKKRNRS